MMEHRRVSLVFVVVDKQRGRRDSTNRWLLEAFMVGVVADQSLPRGRKKEGRRSPCCCCCYTFSMGAAFLHFCTREKKENMGRWRQAKEEYMCRGQSAYTARAPAGGGDEEGRCYSDIEVAHDNRRDFGPICR